MGPFNLYEYLAYILPGGVVLSIAGYGWYGWPYKEPGATALLGLIAASFVVGTIINSFGSWLIDPVILGRRPGLTPSGTWGQFAPGDRHDGESDQFREIFRKRYGDQVTLDQGYALARTEVQRDPATADGLDRLNQQIGFSRGMAGACLVGIGIEACLAMFAHTHLLPALWIPLLVLSTWVFAYRFRRFWRWYGDYILRAIQVLDRR